MKKFLVIVLLSLVVASAASAFDFGLGYVTSGSLQGPALVFEPFPLLTLEGGVNLMNIALVSPTVTLKGKTWMDTELEPAWPAGTTRKLLGYDEIKVSAVSGTAGVRASLNLQRPNGQSKFFLGVGANVIKMLFQVNTLDTFDDGSAKLNGSIGALAGEGVAFCGTELRLKSIPNFRIRAEMGYALTVLGYIQGTLERTYVDAGTGEHIKYMVELTPGLSWGKTYASVGAIWYFLK
jgi:hypothetical protein